MHCIIDGHGIDGHSIDTTMIYDDGAHLNKDQDAKVLKYVCVMIITSVHPSQQSVPCLHHCGGD